ncbi:BTB/POZ and MATH domain-containing protein 1 [Brachypodium distachyon]|uniref:BTB domain-containing protein n=1 Tax=Brachypodium distachyon TaxID=15368 RepID=I1I8N4_BRADI|nr:BTB/POZ and MATH domain-containing protein 1 [Brachypodium distachyon]KQJ99009.1 hypothetical protein BRADI_3g40527v3 [Brachypodium distachyon]|eukprot:XP_003574783.2 BTB/POZ and MATH domain-containing protein 1 [Brachypodium distachyon]
MVDSGSVQFKIDYRTIQTFASDDRYILEESICVGEHRFSASCYPQECSEDGEFEYLSIDLSLRSTSEVTSPVFEALVVGKDGAPSPALAKRKRGTASDFNGLIDGVWKSWCWLDFSKGGDDDMESLWAANGRMITISCGFSVPLENPITVPASDIGDHLRGLLDCADGSDVSFSVGGETFRAHRAVLAARSPVFKAELFGAMAEARMPCITLHDVEPATFKALLCFIYTDALPRDSGELVGDPVDVFQHLLAAADRYALDRLKLLCAHKLWDNVTTDRVADILACAETYNCRELKDCCMDFFVTEQNFKHATLTEGFVRLGQKCPTIIAELRKKARI